MKRTYKHTEKFHIKQWKKRLAKTPESLWNDDDREVNCRLQLLEERERILMFGDSTNAPTAFTGLASRVA